MAGFMQLARGLQAFDSVILADSRTAITDESSPRIVKVLGVSRNYFEFFNTPPTVGRPFVALDVPEPQNAPPLALIGYPVLAERIQGGSVCRRA
jgi:hypothetical protein